MNKRRMIYLGAFLVLIATVVYWGWKTTARGAYESAEYTVIEADGEFEIREYPSLMMATTQMKFEAHGNDGSFGRLFRYISGANEGEQKVAMTTPVFMQPEQSVEEGKMGFVIPKAIARDEIPAPLAGGVQIAEREGGQFAVIRFAGRISPDLFSKQEAKLRDWMEGEGLSGNEDAEFAGYDPPWTPGPLRRNEILIRVE